jgi:hypothetical protein
MLGTLITSKTRIKLLVKFFLNSNARSYLRNLEQEFGDSSNSIRLELNKFEDAGLLISETAGNRKYFQANTQHPLFSDIHSILLKYIGVDQIIETVVKRLGDLSKVYLVGDFAKGINSNLIDLVFVGVNMNKKFLIELIEKAEGLIDRKIRYIVLNEQELKVFIEDKTESDYLLLFENQ